MAIIRPFKALRPHPHSASKVASVPYDVVNTSEARENAKDFPNSFLRITRSEIDFPDDQNPYDEKIYKHAKENLDRIKKEAPLIEEEVPSFYLYRLIMDGRSQIGITATFAVDDYDNNVILKHEKTRKEKEDDRTNHIVTTEAQTGVVFLTYKGIDAVNKVVNNVTESEAPIYDFTSSDGIQHTVWIMPQQFNELIINEIKNSKNLYIADGHHRAASASRACGVKKNRNSSHNGSEEYNYFIAVLFPAEQLKILPYYRVVKDLNGRAKEDFLNEISEKFSVEVSDEKEPTSKNKFGMYLDGIWYKLSARDSVIASNSLSNSVSEKLDVSILQNFLLNPILGIDDPRTNKRIDFVGGIRGTTELERLVNSGKFAVAFSLLPVSVNDLMNISDAGEIMPPKSTWFEPKLRDGLLTHLI
jgi:uncharacterized protein (DUF1015 family)